ncbi:hypothetical protein Syun_027034 [Stephania yunnanensis]|uniref:Uncharacterized protein n=1 Tax=Stephania yunnanensis TaxID=152371 RepID=A0AAP0EM74_9MAGN
MSLPLLEGSALDYHQKVWMKSTVSKIPTKYTEHLYEHKQISITMSINHVETKHATVLRSSHE